MKKVLFVLVSLFISSQAFCQKALIGSITLDATGLTYGIYSEIDCTFNEMYYLDLDAAGYDESAVMFLGSIDIDKFIKNLSTASQKYVAWSENARKNNVKLFSKPISSHFADQTIYFTCNGGWYKEDGVDIHSKFVVDEEGNCMLYVISDEMNQSVEVAHSTAFASSFNGRQIGFSSASSSTKKTMHSSGAQIIFSSKEEIDALIHKLESAKAWKIANRQLGSMFK